MNRALTRYARTPEGVHIGYQVTGDGDAWLLNMKEWGASVDGIWEHPGHRRMLRVLGSVGRVVLFDPRGVGVSDPVAPGQLARLEDWVDDAVTVLDEVGADTVRVMCEGFVSHIAVLLAVSHPDRVSALTIMNGFARLTRGDGYPHGVSEDDADGLVQLVRQWWGTGAVVGYATPSLGRGRDAREFCARFERLGASPATAAEVVRAQYTSDIRPLLPQIAVPTLVAYTGDHSHISIDHSRYLATSIPGAELLETSTTSFYGGEGIDRLVNFALGIPADASDREFATVVFTDVVGSTKHAADWGDDRWRRTLESVDEYVESVVERFGGRIVKQTGDGHLILFHDPGPALRAALMLVRSAGGLDVALHVGVHVGEVELRQNGDISGINVHIAARIAAQADGSEVLVSRTVRDVVAGSDLQFEARGEHQLKGVQGPSQLFAASEARR